MRFLTILDRRAIGLAVAMAALAIVVIASVAMATSGPTVLPVEPDGGIGGEIVLPVEPDGGIGN